jgi:uncharacterized membrane protein
MSERRRHRAGSASHHAVEPVQQASAGAPLSRHHPPSARVELFSDAVFAFAATLLVVALEVPRTYVELVDNLWGFVAFGLSFLTLALIWSSHHAFFRRFPLADRTTIALNAILLFVVLFYVYPLKFMAVAITNGMLGLHPAERAAMFRSLADVRGMFVVYGAGFIAVFGCFSLLYRHARRLLAADGFDPARQREALELQRHYLIMAGVGLLSIALALAGVGVRVGVPGMVYFLIGPLAWAHGAWNRRRVAATSAAA